MICRFVYLESIDRLWAIVCKQISFYHNINKRKGDVMITYEKLWKTMKEKNVSQYKLINTYKVSNGQLDRLRKNQNVSTYTLDQLCKILDCELSDIAEYKKDGEK